DDVDAVLSMKGGKFDILSNLAHIVHACVGRSVDLHDINRGPLRNFKTVGTGAARRAGWPPLAIEGLRENSRDRSLSDAAGSGKEIGLGDSFRIDRVHERLNDVRLSDHVIERSGPVFSCRDLIIQCRYAPNVEW